MNTDVLFSSGKDNWETPHALFAELDEEFHFELDAAADQSNHKTRRWFGPGGEREDGLVDPWPTTNVIWFNPPYSRGLQGKFIDQAVACAKAGGCAVGLLPARTDTRVFHQSLWNTAANRPRDWVREVRFLRGRLTFVGAASSAPFPSMIVVFQT